MDKGVEFLEFERQRKFWSSLWQATKARQSDPVLLKFMNQSYLVLMFPAENCGAYEVPLTQMSFDDNPYKIALDHPDFFIASSASRKLISLAGRFNALDEIPTLKLSEAQVSEKERLNKEILRFDLSGLRVIPSQAEIRFPTMDMDAIRAIKYTLCCDVVRTDMSDVSIRVVLKDR